MEKIKKENKTFDCRRSRHLRDRWKLVWMPEMNDMKGKE